MVCDENKIPEISNFKEIEGAFTKWSLMSTPWKVYFWLLIWNMISYDRINIRGAVSVSVIHSSILWR